MPSVSAPLGLSYKLQIQLDCITRMDVVMAPRTCMKNWNHHAQRMLTNCPNSNGTTL